MQLVYKLAFTLKEDKMIIKDYNYLPEEAKKIRSEVFVKEQGFYDEYDEFDDIAKHMVMYSNEEPISTCRIYYNSEKESYIIGRVAVLKEWRGKNIGRRILNAAEEYIRENGGKSVMLSGQVRVAGFYEKLGYIKQEKPI